MPGKKGKKCGTVTVNGEPQFELPIVVVVKGGPTIRIGKGPAKK